MTCRRAARGVWVGLFEENGYAGVTPSWPDDPESVEEARANPEAFARKTLKRVADHTAKVIGQLDKKPAVMLPSSRSNSQPALLLVVQLRSRRVARADACSAPRESQGDSRDVP